MKSSIENDIRLDTLNQIICDLAKAMSPTCEVILHNIRNPDSSVIAISGNVTDRKIGAPMTDLGIRILKNGDNCCNLINYFTTTIDGRPLRSSTLIIRNSKGNPIAHVCINIDQSALAQLQAVIDTYFPKEHQLREVTAENETKEFFPSNLQELMTSTVSRILGKINKPINAMNRKDKLEFVKLLDEAGVFAIKDAKYYVASMLNTSRYTIYNYLNEVRHQRTT